MKLEETPVAEKLVSAKKKIIQAFLEKRAKTYKRAKYILQGSIIPGLTIYHDKYNLMKIIRVGNETFQPFIDDESGILLFSQDNTKTCVQLTLNEFINKYQMN